jgi:hypothetical protein
MKRIMFFGAIMPKTIIWEKESFGLPLQQKPSFVLYTS